MRRSSSSKLNLLQGGKSRPAGALMGVGRAGALLLGAWRSALRVGGQDPMPTPRRSVAIDFAGQGLNRAAAGPGRLLKLTRT